MSQLAPQQPRLPTESILQRQSSILQRQSSILRKSGTEASATKGTGAAPSNVTGSALARDGRALENANGAQAGLQSGYSQSYAPPRGGQENEHQGRRNSGIAPPRGVQDDGLRGSPNLGAGREGHPGVGDGGKGVQVAKAGEIGGTAPDVPDAIGRQGSFQRRGSFGSAYNVPSMGPATGGSMYGAGFGSMGPAMGGSMHGAGFGSMGPAMGGSMHGAGFGSMGPATGGSMYGAGFGSMGPATGGSMHGAGFGSMGPATGGSMHGAGFGSMGPAMGGGMYGAGYGSMYDGESITAQWAGLNEVSLESACAAGARYYLDTSQNYDYLCPNISTTENHVKLKRSGQRGGKLAERRVKGDNGESISTGATVAPLIVRKTSFSKKEEATATTATTTTAKVPSNYNIHSLILVDKEGDSERDLCISVKDPRTLLFKREGGKDEPFENDECILRDKMSDKVNSVLLTDLQEHWIGGHTTALLVGGGKDRGEASVKFAKLFLTHCLEKLEKNKLEKSTDFDVTVTLGVVESSDRIRDLLNQDNASYEKMQLGSSPVFGPCLCDMKRKTVKSAKECVDVFEKALGRSDKKKQLVVGFFVLKQTRKSSGEKDVYLSSLCMALAREEVSHLNGLREKSTSEPCRLFRYAVGGASVTVTALLVSGRQPEDRGCLELGRKIREVKNAPPRSGNVRRCVEMTKKEISRQQDKMDTMGDTDKKSTERVVSHMQMMVKDCEEMLSNPESNEPKGYPMGGSR
ncbi:uncharacterized protein Tco025E_07184 [Trypanosoma conorhini]|uniref:Uncharacterized protein n=1 Tax=Trypanosoma conorhini TaxID=83891 RepID=A0A3R7L781_9TRYP|nr:uncharacterized protein Tco025E_07184 [Trypanosoma conorhini]RNF08985.1 hypothetical protein Tco025E_07184 [Trypanosoma conorhini]